MSAATKPAATMSDPNSLTPYPEAPSKKHNDTLIELISGSVGGASQVLIGQVRIISLTPQSMTVLY